MNWIPKGYASAKLADNTGLILGDADYRAGFSEWDASLRNPHRHLGTYTTQEYAQAAIERAHAAGVEVVARDPADRAVAGTVTELCRACDGWGGDCATCRGGGLIPRGVTVVDEAERLRQAMRDAIYHLRDTRSGYVTKAIEALEAQVGTGGVMPPAGAPVVDERFRCAREGSCEVTPRCTVQCSACAADGVAPSDGGQR